LSPTITVALWASASVFLTLSFGSSVLFSGAVFLATVYLLIGRFYHDALLRRRLRYELTSEGLAIWVDGSETPRCSFEIFDLRNVSPEFIKPTGIGTIELPPGGWATHPIIINNWDRLVPTMYPCRRLELIADVETVAELIRAEARKRR
jgi:hypothetical protein